MLAGGKGAKVLNLSDTAVVVVVVVVVADVVRDVEVVSSGSSAYDSDNVEVCDPVPDPSSVSGRHSSMPPERR